MSAPRAGVPRRRVDGVLLLDKPLGMSSNAALQCAKRAYAAEKAGHTGTLDPLATGLLPICFGDATKFAQALLDSPKCYVATVRFGAATSTGDTEGEIIAEAPAEFARTDLERAFAGFLGAVEQVPPRYAALKLRGRAYYDYARAGVEIVRRARKVDIHAIEIANFAPPEVTLRVACGKGTYIRVLAEDLGSAMGTVAHLASLRRTAAGPFLLDRAITLPMLEAMDLPDRDALLLAVDAPLAGMSAISLGADAARDLMHGRVAAGPKQGVVGHFRCFGPDGRFLGLVDVDIGGVRAVRLVSGAPASKLGR
jgi:tRNA pseudouridine55 synthase